MKNITIDRIKELLYENSPKDNAILSEGVVADVMEKLLKTLGVAVGETVMIGAENASKKIVTDLLQDVRSGTLKKITRNSILKHPDYAKSISHLANEMSMVKYGRTVDKLTSIEANEITKDAGKVFNGGLEESVKENHINIENDVAGSELTKDATKPQIFSQQAMDNALKGLGTDQLVARESDRMAKILQQMSPQTRNQIQSILNTGVKAPQLVNFDELLNVVKNSGGQATIFTSQGPKVVKSGVLKSLPGKIFKMYVEAGILKKLLALGMGATGIYLFYKRFVRPDTVLVITDETGKDITKTTIPNTGKWEPCVQSLIDKNIGIIAKSPNGSTSVLVKNTEHPKGLNFYTNKRVFDVDNNKMGTYSCKGTKVVAENKISLKGLLDDIIVEQATPTEAAQIARKIYNFMAGDVQTIDIQGVQQIINQVKGKKYKDGTCLLSKVISYYKGYSGSASWSLGGFTTGDLVKDITDSKENGEPQFEDVKKELLDSINGELNGFCKGTTGGDTSIGGKGLEDIDIVWDGDKSTDTTGTTTPTPNKTGRYTQCDSLPFRFGCKSPMIKEIQTCLGMEERYQTGNFGPITKAELVKAGYDITNGITEDVYQSIKGNCTGATNQTSNPPKSPEDTVQGEKPNLTTGTVDKKLTGQPEAQMVEGDNGQKIYTIFQQNYNNGNNPEFPYIFSQGNRIKYKGDGLNQQTLDSLNKYVSSLGYTFIKEKPKEDYEYKYVWQKTK